MIGWIKTTVFLLFAAVAFSACNPEDTKREQNIYFEDIAPQILRDSLVQLKATASSGLPVVFGSGNTNIVTIEGDRAVFHAEGKVYVYASQPGNDEFYEAPNIFHQLVIRDWDPNKKAQTIHFELLPSEWKLSRDGIYLSLSATATSGLPVKFTFSGPKVGFISNSTLFLFHGGESPEFPDTYNVTITIIASQEGNDEYNSSDNIERKMHIIGDVLHG
ncbi:MAG: hypothetical protein EZS26_003370 [Candidatus Ordinivivax streblomastigis]|jgi:hypothetical protein|uniref:Lipoprotein n=1 Tax=Candidatus Ordinivivax streblomastigis TaxID=2540710 RepID=A0A5M8NUQ8_9BACT|nr:MAG: hypothetical protein EZS26_003370 [Candidatus Ordinivivax streblomastigis]